MCTVQIRELTISTEMPLRHEMAWNSLETPQLDNEELFADGVST
jgi:hypothetical protein